MTTLEAPALAPAYAYHRGDRVLHIDHVSLSLGGHQILRDVDAEVLEVVGASTCLGQIVCVLGPSGIGKTRLARIVAGLDAPTAGRVTLIHDRPTVRGHAGLVPQNYPLFEFTSVLNNFKIAGRQAGVPWATLLTKVTELVEDFGLQAHLSMYPAQLSGGTRQRVAIVRQLLCSDHLLVMDEPFSGLDPIMKRRACEMIVKAANRDSLNTILINTHDVTEGMTIADTVWLLGYEPDAAGGYLPGARIVERYDLAALGFAWREDLQTDPSFLSLVADVKARFRTLK